MQLNIKIQSQLDLLTNISCINNQGSKINKKKLSYTQKLTDVRK